MVRYGRLSGSAFNQPKNYFGIFRGARNTNTHVTGIKSNTSFAIVAGLFDLGRKQLPFQMTVSWPSVYHRNEACLVELVSINSFVYCSSNVG